jgi:hypothetical protein
MGLPYEILAQGYFAESELIVHWTPSEMNRNLETKHLIEESWSARQADAQARNQVLFPGELCRLVNWKESSDTLSITFGSTDYKELVGTNLSNPEIASRFGEEYLSNGTAACSVVVTTDHKLIVQRRNERVYEYPGRYHVCGGNLEPDKCGSSKCPSPFAEMRKELREEILVESHCIVDMHCLGIARDSHTLKPEILFETLLSIPSDSIVQGPGPEHQRLLLLEESASEVLEFLISAAEQFVPVGLACLVAWGRRRYGSSWYEDFLIGIDSQ